MLVVKTGSFILSPVAGRAVLVKVGHGDEEDEEEGAGISCCKFGISFFPRCQRQSYILEIGVVEMCDAHSGWKTTTTSFPH